MAWPEGLVRRREVARIFDRLAAKGSSRAGVAMEVNVSGRVMRAAWSHKVAPVARGQRGVPVAVVQVLA